MSGTMEARTPGGGSGVVCDTGIGTSDGTVGRASCPPARGASEDAHGYTTTLQGTASQTEGVNERISVG